MGVRGTRSAYRRRLTVGVVVSGCLAAALAPAVAAPTRAAGYVERQVLGTAQERAGEPEIAVDPRDPRHVFMVDAVGRGSNYSDHPVPTDPTVLTGPGRVTFATSSNGGRSWGYEKTLPIIAPGQPWNA